ncbi:MAG: tetratricopeptide repeat protein [Waterburya sp.]
MDRPTQQQKKAISHIYAEQAWIYFQEQNWQGAIVACKNALESDSHNAEAYKILGNVLKVKGKKAEALGVYAKALAINPNSAAIYANLGSFYAEQKKWQQALDYYQQAVILDPSLAGAYRSLAQVWEELGDTNQALECFCQAVNLDPERLTAQEYFSFGQQLYQQGKIKEASIFYTHGVKLNPEAESELSQLVKILEELEEWQQAVIYYHRLLSLSDDSFERQDKSDNNKPIKNLLSRSKSKSRTENAISLKKATQRRIPAPSSPALRQNELDNTPPSLIEASSTVNSAGSKLLPEAKTKIETGVKQQSETKKPDSAISWNNLGSLYAQKQQWTRAISCYQEAVEIDPNLSKTYRNLARVYSKIGKDLQSALCWYEAFTLEAERVKPEEHFILAKKLLQQQQVDKAIACLHLAVKLKPDFNQAHLILGKLFESQGKQEAAKACYEKIKKEEKEKNDRGLE